MKKILSLFAALVLAMGALADNYVQVTAASDIADGDYVLATLTTTGDTAIVWEGTDAAYNGDTIALTDGKLVLTDPITITLASLNGGYSVLVNGGANNGKYISSGTSAPTYANGLKFITTATAVSFELNADNTVKMYQSGDKDATLDSLVYMLYNSSKSNYRFRFYKGTNYNNYPKPVLFKKEAAAVAGACANDPAWPANQVIAIYSDAYTVDPAWGYCEGWGQTTTLNASTCASGNNVLEYSNFNYLGWGCASTVNAINMEKLHLDIYSESADSVQIGVVPIYGGSGLATDDSHRAFAKCGQGWNSIDFDLATDFAGLNLSSIFQFKFDNGTTTAFKLDNVYFYRTTPIQDTEAPTGLTATVASADVFSVTLALTATDNMGLVNYLLINGNDTVKVGGASAATVNGSIKGLTPNTAYTFTVIATDANGNASSPVTVATTTAAGPTSAPAPTYAASRVKSLYSDAYTFAPASLQSYNEGWWNAPTLDEGNLAAGDKVLYYHGANITNGMIGWQFAPIDATGYTHFHCDIYVAKAGAITLGPTFGGDGLTTAVYNQAGAQNLVAGWNSIDLDLTGDDLSSMFQMQFTGYGDSQFDGFFVDNVFFYNPAPVAVLENVNTIANIKACYADQVIKDNDVVNVKGYIVSMFLKPSNFAKYGSVSIWMTDTLGGTTKEFELYNCYGIGGDTLATFGPDFNTTGTSNVDVDTVVDRNGVKYIKGAYIEATGKIKLYNTTYELNTGCQITKVVNPESGDEPATEDVYSIKHPWNGGEWTWKDMENTTYLNIDASYYVGQWGDNGFNIAINHDEANAAWIVKDLIMAVNKNGSVISLPAVGTEVTFIYLHEDLTTVVGGGRAYIVYEPTALENTEATEEVEKVMIDGQLYIIKNGVRYNVLGAVVK